MFHWGGKVFNIAVCPMNCGTMDRFLILLPDISVMSRITLDVIKSTRVGGLNWAGHNTIPIGLF